MKPPGTTWNRGSHQRQWTTRTGILIYPGHGTTVLPELFTDVYLELENRTRRPSGVQHDTLEVCVPLRCTPSCLHKTVIGGTRGLLSGGTLISRTSRVTLSRSVLVHIVSVGRLGSGDILVLTIYYHQNSLFQNPIKQCVVTC